MRLIFLLCLAFIVFSPALANAKTLEQYRENVRYARDLTVLLLYPDEETTAAGNAQMSEAEILTKIRKILAAHGRMPFSGKRKNRMERREHRNE